jgi:hypothetical protein
MLGPVPAAATRVALAPSASDAVAAAVVDGGGEVVELADQPDALVWSAPDDPSGLAEAVRSAPSLQWGQLPFAGVERFVDELDPSLTWTCAKGVYAEPVAEHALALALAGLRSLRERARAASWGEQAAETLYDAPVVVLGAGGITSSLLELLAPFRCPVTVVRRSGEPVPGAARTVAIDRLDEVLPEARVVVLALALTPETRHVVGRAQLAAMSSSAWLVNVARGGARRHRRARRGPAGRADRRRRARRHRPRAAAGRPPAVGPADLPDHPAHGQPVVDRAAAAGPPGRRERPALDGRRAAARPRRPRPGLLTVAADRRLLTGGC